MKEKLHYSGFYWQRFSISIRNYEYSSRPYWKKYLVCFCHAAPRLGIFAWGHACYCVCHSPFWVNSYGQWSLSLCTCFLLEERLGFKEVTCVRDLWLQFFLYACSPDSLTTIMGICGFFMCLLEVCCAKREESSFSEQCDTPVIADSSFHFNCFCVFSKNHSCFYSH